MTDHLQSLMVLPDATTPARLALRKARWQHDRKPVHNGVDDGRLVVSSRDLRLAAQRLGVRWPIRVRWMSAYDSNAVGLYISTSDHEHEIRLRRGCSATDTAKVLRHELAHAAQREAAGFNGFEARRDAHEREAWELSWTLNDISLVRDALAAVASHPPTGGGQSTRSRAFTPAVEDFPLRSISGVNGGFRVDA